MSELTAREFLLARISEDETACEAASNDVEWIGGRLIPLRSRLLADCEAKRRIVEEHRPFRLAETVCQRCEERGQIGYEDMVVEWPCPTIRALASIWSDHPDFREEWR